MGHFQFQLQHVKVIIPIFLKELCRDTVDTQNHLFKLYNLVICDMFTDMHNHHHSKFQNYFYHSKKKNSLSFSCHTHNSLDFIPATPHSGAVVKNLPANAADTASIIDPKDPMTTREWPLLAATREKLMQQQRASISKSK